MRILLAGGGSGGPVSPVLAVAAEIKKLKPKTAFLFVGTRQGPERVMVGEAGYKFTTIPAARWRRFFTIKNLFAPLVFLGGLVKSFFIVRKFRPDAVFSAGGFVAVPVCWVAKLLGAKIIIHQQDILIGLANKLISPVADHITTAFEFTSKEFYSNSGIWNQKFTSRSEWVGNPVREDLFKPKADAKKIFNLHDELPVLLVLGGATGALQINKMIADIIPQLVQNYQVIHQTGKGKHAPEFKDRNYHVVELIPFDEYAAALKLAHAVVARAGLSTIAELSALGKPAIVIPMPKTHQDDNAKILLLTSSAVVLAESNATSENLLKVAVDLKFNPALTETLSQNISKLMPNDAAGKIAKAVLKYGQ